MSTEKYIELLREMVRIPSPSFEEGAVADHICGFLEKEGILHQRERNNILSVNRRFDPAKPTLALDAHIDTVPPAESYTRDPYDPGTDPETVWGLGSNDDGGSVVSMIAVFTHFYDAELPFNLMLVITCEEERAGADGSVWLYGPRGYFSAGSGVSECGDGTETELGTKSHERYFSAGSGVSECETGLGVKSPVEFLKSEVQGIKFPRPDWVIVGEPTGMKAATSERGLLVLDGEAHGVSGHAARGEGVNALYIAMDDIARMRDFKFDKHSELMGDVRLTVTQIEAGSVHNIIPDLCRFTVDIRPTEKYTNEEIWRSLQTVCQSTLTPRRLTNRSSATYEGSPLLKAAEALGIETFSSPTTSDWMQTGCDAIKMGPGESSRSHHADEFIYVSEIEDAVEKYIAFIGEMVNFVG